MKLLWTPMPQMTRLHFAIMLALAVFAAFLITEANLAFVGPNIGIAGAWLGAFVFISRWAWLRWMDAALPPELAGILWGGMIAVPLGVYEDSVYLGGLGALSCGALLAICATCPSRRPQP